MISSPRPGQPVQVWHKASVALVAPLHGKRGVVVLAAKGPGPRNHGIEIDGTVYNVPAGNLRQPLTDQH
jgi:hypothetical protein